MRKTEDRSDSSVKKDSVAEIGEKEGYMRYFGGAVTDISAAKSVKQDSLCLKIAQTELYGQIAMAVICDGMGGLEKV